LQNAISNIAFCGERARVESKLSAAGGVPLHNLFSRGEQERQFCTRGTSHCEVVCGATAKRMMSKLMAN